MSDDDKALWQQIREKLISIKNDLDDLDEILPNSEEHRFSNTIDKLAGQLDILLDSEGVLGDEDDDSDTVSKDDE